MELSFSPKCKRIKKTLSLPASLVTCLEAEARKERRSFNFIVEEKLRFIFAPNCHTVALESESVEEGK